MGLNDMLGERSAPGASPWSTLPPSLCTSLVGPPHALLTGQAKALRPLATPRVRQSRGTR